MHIQFRGGWDEKDFSAVIEVGLTVSFGLPSSDVLVPAFEKYIQILSIPKHSEFRVLPVVSLFVSSKMIECSNLCLQPSIIELPVYFDGLVCF